MLRRQRGRESVGDRADLGLVSGSDLHRSRPPLSSTITTGGEGGPSVSLPSNCVTDLDPMDSRFKPG